MSKTDKQGSSMGVRTANYQGGSIISYVIITVAIAALLIGGVAFLRQRGESAQQSGSATESSQEQSGDEVATNDADSTKQESESGEANKDGTQGSVSDPDATKSDAEEQGAGGEAAVSEQTTPDVLPETGAAETVMFAVVLAAVTYATMRYIQSRRQLMQL